MEDRDEQRSHQQSPNILLVLQEIQNYFWQELEEKLKVIRMNMRHDGPMHSSDFLHMIRKIIRSVIGLWISISSHSFNQSLQNPFILLWNIIQSFPSPGANWIGEGGCSIICTPALSIKIYYLAGNFRRSIRKRLSEPVQVTKRCASSCLISASRQWE